MLERFRHIIEDASSSCYLLAVSGGVDSMTMAELFLATVPASSIAVANCNFHLRGTESDGDSEMVRHWAEKRGIRCFHTDFDTLKYASEKGKSIEMAARELRYCWFAELCSIYGFDAVAVAHNANDNAETLVLNLLRGTGLKGICGMQERGVLPYSESDAILFRPMLSFSREEIEEYALSNGIVWREDSTNSSVEYKRNRLRNNLFSEFEKINPSFLDTLGRDMTYFSQAQSVLDSWWESIGVCKRDGAGNLTIDVDSLKACGHPDYALFRALEPYGFNSSVIDQVLNSLGSSGKVFFSEKYVLMSSSGILTVALRKPDCSSESILVEEPGEYALGDTRFSVICRKFTSDISLKQPDGTTMFDSSSLCFPLMFRRWKEGDWMCPLGLGGRKKLSDLFVDLKFNPEEKASSLILAFDEGSRVASLVGKRIDEKIKVTPSCESVTIIKKLQ